MSSVYSGAETESNLEVSLKELLEKVKLYYLSLIKDPSFS